MARTFSPAIYLVLIFLMTSAGRSQSPPTVSIVPRARPESSVNPDGTPDVHLRVDTSLVLVPVHAVSPRGTSITHLIQTDFRVYEDGVQQKISYFTKQDAPLSVGLVFDSSGSMSNKIRKSAEAAAAFFKTANADDEFFLVEFGERAKLQMPFTTDPGEIYRKIAHSKPFGRTSLIDAIHLALRQMKNARYSRRAIVILSDGGDNRSRLTRSEIKGALLESNVQMYAMGIFNAQMSSKQTREEENGPDLLEELAAQTGGKVYPVGNLDELESISTALGNTLRNEYLLGYLPSNTFSDGKYRHVKVDLAEPNQTHDLHISYRQGYYAPRE